jgi:hypothetical protein
MEVAAMSAIYNYYRECSDAKCSCHKQANQQLHDEEITMTNDNDQLEQAHADYESAMVNDDELLDARDMAEEIEQARQPTQLDVALDTFKAVIDEWTEACLLENRKTSNPDMILTIMRLGTLGQRLIYKANAVGMRETLAMSKGSR